MKSITYILFMFLIVFTSCSEDFLEQTPSNRPSEEVLFATLEGAKIHLTGIYSLQNYPYGEGTRNIIAPDVMGDDCLVVSSNNYSRYINFYNFNFAPADSRAYEFWQYSYRTISNCNLFLEQIVQIKGDEKVKADLEAQAHALRAFSYFNLIRWFGETAYTVDAKGRGVIINNTVNDLDGYNIPRSDVSEVYDQILADLDKAEAGSLPNEEYKGYIDASGVAALQARVYLTMGDWTKASKYAKKAYSGFTLIDETTYLSGFNNVSSEDIWSQKFVDSDVNTYLSIPSFTYTSKDITLEDKNEDGTVDLEDLEIGYKGDSFVFGYNSIRVTRGLIDLFSATDFRKKMFPITKYPDGNIVYLDPPTNSVVQYAQFTTSEGYLTSKWQSRDGLGTGDFSRIRASEMYLIEAEAEARLGNDGAAQAALLKIQKRADASVSTITKTGQDLIDEIILERRKELFLEGHRFFDLKRLDLDLSRTLSTNSHWSKFTDIGLPKDDMIERNSVSNRFCLPIPQLEIDANQALKEFDQNEVYK